MKLMCKKTVSVNSTDYSKATRFRTF